MNNRISGDFDSETLESFRAMYSQREVKPEDLEVDQYTGLPTDVVTNISPWIQHTGLWKANPGTDRGFVPNQVLEEEEEFDDTDITEEEFDRMVNEVLSDLEEEERFADEIYNGDDGDDGEDDEGEDDASDEEIERLIESILAEVEEEEPFEEDVEDDVEVPSEEEIDDMIAKLWEEIEEEEEERDRIAASNRETSNDELEDMIRDLDTNDDGDGDGDAEVDTETEPELELEPEPDGEGEDVAEEVLSDDDIDSLLNEILGDTEDDTEEES